MSSVSIRHSNITPVSLIHLTLSYGSKNTGKSTSANAVHKMLVKLTLGKVVGLITSKDRLCFGGGERKKMRESVFLEEEMEFQLKQRKIIRPATREEENINKIKKVRTTM